MIAGATPSQAPSVGSVADAASAGARAFTFEANVQALAARSPWTAMVVREALPYGPDELAWIATPTGAMSARWGPGADAACAGRLLASAHDAADEARELVSSIAVEEAGLFAVMGLGVGHHVDALARRLGRHGAIFVFEPDVRLLRSVLERVDLAPILLSTSTFVFTDPRDGVAMSTAARGVEGLVALGVTLVDHPASRARLGESAGVFASELTAIVRTVKTTVMTTLLNSEVTLRNELMNLDHYGSQHAWSNGLADLAGAYRGRPAVVVAAGPSLRRNIELLTRPELRERVVVIAVQTVLKTLLARGITPDFVTALDYHEISRRFYEGLTERDVAGVTLVCESKASPAILEAWPKSARSPIVCPASATLDAVLGHETDAKARITPGATVAHLAYYLGRHLGCDPVILIGQDLGFTDGQYYASGAAIHSVWGGELNSFRTLEMMEWERIARHRAILHRVEDQQGRPIYTDDQMNAYRLQFERDFAADAATGLATIDATEGGVKKANAVAMSLEEALAAAPAGPIERVALARGASDRARAEREQRAAARGRLDAVRAETLKVAHHSREAADILRRMLRAHGPGGGDQRKVNALIAEVNEVRDRVKTLETAFGLVQLLNQTGTLRRVKADRALALAQGMDAAEAQRRQIERDLENVTWLADAADSLAETMRVAVAAFDGGVKLTAEVPVEAANMGGPDAARRATIAAVVPLDRARLNEWSRGGWRLDAECVGGCSAIRLLLGRLSRASEIDRVVVLTDDPETARSLVSSAGPLPRPVQIVRATEPMSARREAMVAGRAVGRECWRGGVSNLSIYDEAFESASMAALCDQLALDGVVPIDATWCFVDPVEIDKVVSRHRGHSVECTSDSHKLTFAQAAPGLGVCVLSRHLVKELSAHAATAGVFATIGGMLGYIPVAPQPDPIAKPHCHTPDPIVRDLAVRVIVDSAASRASIARALAPLGASVLSASAEQIAELLSDASPTINEVVFELNTGRLTSGLRGQWLRGRSSDTIERTPMPVTLASSILSQIGSLNERGVADAMLTLYGAGDPVLHPELPRIVGLARRNGVRVVHVRTDLAGDESHVEAIVEAAADIVSVDLNADSAATYRTVMGTGGCDRVRGHLERLLAARERVSGSRLGLATPLIVPRMTRCDATLGEIESFYDRWLLVAGAAVIDPLPTTWSAPGERILALAVPERVARRLSRRTLTILCDGSVVVSGDWHGERVLGDLNREPLEAIVKRQPEFERRRATARREVFSGASGA